MLYSLVFRQVNYVSPICMSTEYAQEVRYKNNCAKKLKMFRAIVIMNEIRR